MIGLNLNLKFEHQLSEQQIHDRAEAYCRAFDCFSHFSEIYSAISKASAAAPVKKPITTEEF